MIRLIVADDHIVLRQALCEMLEKKTGYEIVAQAGDGNELLKALSEHSPDIVIMDLAMPNCDGISAMEQLKSSGREVPILVLSANEGERNVRSALKAGAKGYLPKNASSDELEFAIKSIINGKTYLSPSVTEPLMGSGSENPTENPVSRLTKRELEILCLLADGKPNKEIGKMLHISPRTVDTHRSNILKKLEARTNAELVKIAIANDLITV